MALVREQISLVAEQQKITFICDSNAWRGRNAVSMNIFDQRFQWLSQYW